VMAAAAILTNIRAEQYNSPGNSISMFGWYSTHSSPGSSLAGRLQLAAVPAAIGLPACT
jgi:hypothetical protein